MKILQNQAKCLKCNTSIYSAHRHDYVTCPCGSLSVDGGLDYLKRGFKDKPNYIEESISISADLFDTLNDKLEWCSETNRNDLGRICAIFRVFNEQGYDLIKREERESANGKK